MKILNDILGWLSHSKSSEQFSCLSSLRNNISKGKIILAVQRSVCIVAPLLKKYLQAKRLFSQFWEIWETY